MADEYVGVCDGCGEVEPLEQYPLHSIDDYQELCKRCREEYDKIEGGSNGEEGSHEGGRDQFSR